MNEETNQIKILEDVLSGKYDDFEILQLNIQYNSTNGIIRVGCDNHFIKILDKQCALNEMKNWESLKGYPTPLLEAVIPNHINSVLIYKFEDSISEDKGLLVDFINENINVITSYYQMYPLIKIWQEVFLKTIKVEAGERPNSRLFKHRICDGGRFDEWYNSFYVTLPDGDISFRELMKYKFVVNGTSYGKTLEQFHKEVKENLLSDKERMIVMSQGDPLEMNIGMKPVFFDFENSGMNEFIGETAVFIFGILIDGGYFSPKYHSNAYHTHRNAINNIKYHKYLALNYEIVDDNVVKIDYELQIPPIRKKILKDYLTNVVTPVLDKVGMDFGEYQNQLKHYLFMRSLCVHNPLKMSKEDIFFNIGLLYEVCEKGLLQFLEPKNDKILL